MTTLQLRRKLCQRPELWPLEMCLKTLGVKPDVERSCLGSKRKVYGFRSIRMHSCDNSDGRLWHFYELAKKRYLKLCKKFRVDLVENHEQAAWLNVLWAHTERLFNRRGIEV